MLERPSTTRNRPISTRKYSKAPIFRVPSCLRSCHTLFINVATVAVPSVCWSLGMVVFTSLNNAFYVPEMATEKLSE